MAERKARKLNFSHTRIADKPGRTSRFPRSPGALQECAMTAGSDSKWVSLIDAVRMVVRLGEDGDRLASFITCPQWARYERDRIAVKHGMAYEGDPIAVKLAKLLETEEGKLLESAEKAFNSAVSLLRVPAANPTKWNSKSKGMSLTLMLGPGCNASGRQVCRKRSGGTHSMT
jgi:hypothetical protein